MNEAAPDDAAVRALIAAVRADRTLSRSDLVLNLAHAAEALLAEITQVRATAGEEIAHLDAELARMRGVVAEEIARDAESRLHALNGLTWQQMTARIAREHSKEDQS